MIRVIRDSGSDSDPRRDLECHSESEAPMLSPGDSQPSQYSATPGGRLNLSGLQPALTA